MLNLKYIFYFIILFRNCVYFTNCQISIDKNEYSTQMLLDEMIAHQKCNRQLNVLKGTLEHLNLMSNTENDSNEGADSTIFDIRVDALPEKCQTVGVPSSCVEATACTKRSGYYYIKLENLNNDTNILVECDAHTEGGTWTVIQRRQDGSVDFYRPWDDYVAGFGDIEGEFFIGLDKLYVLTNFDGPQELMILMETENGKGVSMAYAKYNSFMIEGEHNKYKLKRIGKYSGNAGNALENQIGQKFSTKDQDNDSSTITNCAEKYMGAWWYKSCHMCNLNGHYGDTTVGRGINWNTLVEDTVSLKYVQMMIRRQKYKN